MDSNKDISYIVFEGEMARAERHIKRLWITVIVLILSIVALCAGFLIYLSQFDVESYQVSTEGGGNANYIGNDGDITNGESNSSQATQIDKENGEETR
jgi:hypothetical protein